MIKQRRRNRGTSIVELLVVIVVLLIGILGVVQIFPGGFSALRITRNNAVATQLARAQIDMLKGQSAQLPEMILPVRYVWQSGQVAILSDPGAASAYRVGLVSTGVGIDGSGQVLDSDGNALGYWPYLSGANIARRIVGEGGDIPAPRDVNGQYGGLMVLQFAPIVFNPSNDVFFRVYGNDMVVREGEPRSAPRDWLAYIDETESADARLYLPRSATQNREYRIQVSVYAGPAGSLVPRDYVDVPAIQVPAGPGGWYDVLVSDLLPLNPGEQLASVQVDSVRVSRIFTRRNSAAEFTGDPYEFLLLDANLGVLMFSPAAYNVQEGRPGGRRVTLKARVNYDVFDWRILREEFRIDDREPYQHQLKVPSIRTRNSGGIDGRTYLGLDVPIPDGSGGTQSVDVILQDVETGGTYLFDNTYPRDPNPPSDTVNDYLAVNPARSSYAVDGSVGFMRFLDYDRGTPGLQLRLILPGATSPVTVNADGRVVRALYQANGDFAVQVLKAPSRFWGTDGPPGIAQFALAAGPRVIFSSLEEGKNITLGEVWYTTAGGQRRVLYDQTGVVQPAGASDAPFIDIRSFDPDAAAFDFSNGYAVRRVRGASVSARVLWNPGFFSLGGDAETNLRAYENWARSTRRTTVDTFLQRGEN